MGFRDGDIREVSMRNIQWERDERKKRIEANKKAQLKRKVLVKRLREKE